MTSRSEMSSIRMVFTLACLLWLGCSQDSSVSGTSSGVDNPGLTVAFVDSLGAPVKTSGTLEVYAVNQNPIFDPLPLLSFKVEGTASTVILPGDFDRSISMTSPSHSLAENFLSSKALAKIAAMGPGDSLKTNTPNGESIVGDSADLRFNILMRTGNSGVLLVGLGRKGNRFLDTNNKNLITVKASLRPFNSLKGGVKDRRPDSISTQRVFIPGSPFLSVLSDSGFLFPELPVGKYSLNFQDANGIPRPLKEGEHHGGLSEFEIDGAHEPENHGPENPPPLEVHAGSDRDVFVDAELFLKAEVRGGIPERITALWTILEQPENAGAVLVSPTSLTTQGKLTLAGFYRFEIRVLDGNREMRDTVAINARAKVATNSEFLHPSANDTVFIGQPFKVSFRSNRKMQGRLEFSADSASTFAPILEVWDLEEGVNTFVWTPSPGIRVSENCRLRVIPNDGKDAIKMVGVFKVR